MIEAAAVNLPHVQAAVASAFHLYESALMRNDLATLDTLFWQSPLAMRFGANETLYGIEAIQRYRAARDASAITRSLRETTITTFAEDLAVTTTLFERPGQATGRQTQTWVHFAEGWRIVLAHISFQT